MRAGEYARHRPEQTLLYQRVEAHYPAFVEHLAARERTLPRPVPLYHAPGGLDRRLSLTTQGNIRYRLKTPYRDGTTDGVFAPNHRSREQMTPARRGRRKTETGNEPAPARHVAMSVKRNG